METNGIDDVVRRVITKEKLCFILGAILAWIAGLFGGWNSAMTDLFSSVGRKTAYINTVYEEVINTTDVYYLGIVTNANGVAILGSTSTLTNNEPYVNGFIDNIVNFKIDDLKTLYSISSSETGYKVNSSSDAYYLRLLSNSNTNI